MADITNRDLTQTLKLMSWERCKGELRAMLHTYQSEYDRYGEPIGQSFTVVSEKVEKFVKEMDNIIL